ncbi:hypothetical protein [Polyangium spumosum]|uniref:Uncharacterized protein n=1 Tax=Polyangium spumosum TaxID=889282 RepID=A0A6N7Q583_9BACT|nr:hypothetical protein [Polyangium spumosum]MRG97434.1 hypothetical protein [Polyangium spumosum]
MDNRSDRGTGYVVPTYEAPKGAAFHHFLHGNVPGHEIDFIYRPTMADGPLSRQHFGHLSRLLMFIEPRGVGGSAFAIGNLSRDDSHHEPGHGGLAFIVSLRIRGARDHAGRLAPSFSHAIAMVDRDFDANAILDASLAFERRVFSGTRPNAEDGGFYHAYARCVSEAERARGLLEGYTNDFTDLPIPGPSKTGLRYSAAGVTQPRRVVVLHADGASFEDLARAASRIAAILYRSDVKWTAVSDGRESDLPGGLTVRLMPASEAGVPEEGIAVHRLEELPEAEEELALRLFGARPTQKYGMPGARPEWRRGAELSGARVEEKARGGGAAPDREDAEATVRRAPRRRGWVAFLGIALVAAAGIGAAVLQGQPEPEVEAPPALSTPAPVRVTEEEATEADEVPGPEAKKKAPGHAHTAKTSAPRPAGATGVRPGAGTTWKGSKPAPTKTPAPTGKKPCKPGVLGDCPE